MVLHHLLVLEVLLLIVVALHEPFLYVGIIIIKITYQT